MVAMIIKRNFHVQEECTSVGNSCQDAIMKGYCPSCLVCEHPGKICLATEGNKMCGADGCSTCHTRALLTHLRLLSTDSPLLSLGKLGLGGLYGLAGRNPGDEGE